ncbi:isochorismatase [Rhodococcus sp. ACS1]|uniref:cysteine hydrolase family protein n=1 Tax=Rhodococcus sp. ACS1 TaxID=2028570 RepID=UPI000BB1276D|nr:cysteine hydrolase [Rhodococcus sp. ACS1]PBC52089.1 isochorismatase [Rhodococcus sp. ACS1]
MTTRKTGLDPRSTALLVLDIQDGIVESLPDPQPLLDSVFRAITCARSAGATVGYVRVALTERDRTAVPPTNITFTAIAGTKLLVEGDPSTGIHSRVTPAPGDLVVRKTRIGALSTTDLDDQLTRRGITTVVLAGISTGGVVLSTVADMADRDYGVYVLSDAVADMDPEVHRVLVEKVFPTRARVINVDRLRILFTGL